MLIDCVQGGDSVGFMLPISRSKAEAFWQSLAVSVQRGARRVLDACDSSSTLIGTVQVILQQPENQPDARQHALCNHDLFKSLALENSD